MRPILFVIDGLRVPSYTVFSLMGFGVGIAVFLFESRRRGFLDRAFLVLLAAGTIGGTIGSMLPLWAYHLWLSRTQPLAVSQILSGRTVVGGLIGGWIVIEAAKKVLKIDHKTGDAFAPAIALGLAIGRIGCLLNGCCYGIASTLPWAVDFGDGILRHPTQIYSALFDLGLFIFLWISRKRITKEGDLFKRFLYLFCIFRFAIEFIRVSPRVFLGLSGFQWATLAIIVYLLPGDIVSFARRSIRS